MKHYGTIAIAAALLLASCSEKLSVGHDVPSSVYVVNAGEYSVTVTSETENCKVWVYKSGWDSRPTPLQLKSMTKI